MSVAEVERIEGVGRGVMGLIWLWKYVEKSKVRRIKAMRGHSVIVCLSSVELPVERGLASHLPTQHMPGGSHSAAWDWAGSL